MSGFYATVKRVARSPDEFALLSAIADHPADDLRRLVYADWLQDQGDPRGAKLRGIVTAARDGKPLPKVGRLPAAWADLTGVSLIQGLTAAGLGPHLDTLMALARPAVVLTADDGGGFDPMDSGTVPHRLGTTRLGGPPDLPAGTAYPTGHDGRALSFIGQFDMTDLRGTVAGRAFPDEGLLSVFAHPEFEDDGDATPRVLLTGLGAALERVERPPDGPEPGMWCEPFRGDLTLTEALELPLYLKGMPGAGLVPVGVWDTYSRCVWSHAPRRTLLHGYSRPPGQEMIEPLAGRPDWVQLGTFPAETEFGSGNGHDTVFILPAADLKAGRFDQVVVEDG